MPEETEEHAQETPVGMKVEKRLSPHNINLYVNQTEFAITPWDIQIQLGHVHGEGSGLVIEQVATVTMSPQHAKAFAIALATNVREWEKSNSEIMLSETIIARAGAVSSKQEGAQSDTDSETNRE